MRCRTVALVLAAAMMLPASGGLLAQAAPDTEAAAKALVPLLKSVRQRLQPHIGIEPGSLPPSPFTGRQSTMIAVRIGEKEVNVDPRVREALDRLLAWDLKPSSDASTATLFGHWLDRLQSRAGAMGPPGSPPAACDTACTVERFTKPGEAFGQSRKAREETRDQLLLEALAEAVDEVAR